MPSRKLLMVCLTSLLCAGAVSSCASKPDGLQTHPSAELLAVEPGPEYPAAGFTSTAARDAFYTDLLTWARKGWAKVAGNCAYAKERGMPDAPC